MGGPYAVLCTTSSYYYYYYYYYYSFYFIPSVVKIPRVKNKKRKLKSKLSLEKRSEVRIVAAGECIMQKHGVETLNSNRDALV